VWESPGGSRVRVHRQVWDLEVMHSCELGERDRPLQEIGYVVSRDVFDEAGGRKALCGSYRFYSGWPIRGDSRCHKAEESTGRDEIPVQSCSPLAILAGDDIGQSAITRSQYWPRIDAHSKWYCQVERQARDGTLGSLLVLTDSRAHGST
jgi:hypothetical protein